MAAAAAAAGGYTHSRTLFLQEDGSPLRFYVRPGPKKRQMFPLISHGGGVMCRLQEPGALLLGESGGPHYISTSYVSDCVRRDERLDPEDYRLGKKQGGEGNKKGGEGEKQGGESDKKQGGESDKKQVGEGDKKQGGEGKQPGAEEPQSNGCPITPGAPSSPAVLRSRPLRRNFFTEEEDVAILMYVRDNEPALGKVTGTRLWKEIEKRKVVRRSWQAAKDRYRKNLIYNMGSYKLPARGTPHQNKDLRRGKQKPGTYKEVVTRSSKVSPTAEESVTTMEGRRASPGSPEEDSPMKEGIGEKEATGPHGRKKAAPMNPDEAKHRDDEGADVRIFEIANLEFEVDDTPELEVPGESLALKDFVMGEDTPVPEGQTQVDEVSSSPTPSQEEREGLREGLLSMMSEFKMSLPHVTQALLKNSGELEATRHFLRTGRRHDGYPIWVRKDDLVLLKDDTKLQEKLVTKYGSDNVAKRVAFLAS
ncbi:telomeric repeat-binding factor 2-interacting protein 1 [Ascaphus truei]|uniref:telomeric repeat-binding factor 2-interacting protein 1 n=1 Tax=Ascaphus truei TaxID=8439 RepID=UPI003F59C625